MIPIAAIAFVIYSIWYLATGDPAAYFGAVMAATAIVFAALARIGVRR